MTDATPAPLGSIAHYTLLEQLAPGVPGDVSRARDTKALKAVALPATGENFSETIDERGSREHLVGARGARRGNRRAVNV